jgi:hypothetical protein
VGECEGESVDPNRELGVAAQPQEDHPGVRVSVPKDELTKVLVIGDQDPLLVVSNHQHLRVGETRGMVPGDSGGVVAKALEVGEQASISALIKQKPH